MHIIKEISLNKMISVITVLFALSHCAPPEDAVGTDPATTENTGTAGTTSSSTTTTTGSDSTDTTTTGGDSDSSSSTSDSSDSSSTSTGSSNPIDVINEAIETLNPLATAYPGALSLSIFPQTTGLQLTEDSKRKTKTIVEKKKEADAILKGTGDSCLAGVFSEQPETTQFTCYEFDQEMMYGPNPGGTIYGTRNGLSSTEEACLVSFSRSQVKKVESMIDKALGYVQGMMCQAKKDGLAEALPAIGETIDLATSLGTAMGTKVSSITKASIKRLADQSSRPVFRIEIIAVNGTETRETYLVHSPASETDNSTYNGVLWSKITGFVDPFDPSGGSAKLTLTEGDPQQQPGDPQQQPGDPQQQPGDPQQQPGNAPAPLDPNDQPTDPHLSVRYAKILKDDGTYSLQAELIRGNVKDTLSANAFVNGELNLNVGADFEGGASDPNYGKYKDPETSNYMNHNQAVTNMTYVAFNLNPVDSSGTVSYWQNPGSSYTENARGMIFALTKDTETETLKGCGISGATTGGGVAEGISIRKMKNSTDVFLKAKGFLHPFAHLDQQSPCNVEQGTDEVGPYYSLPQANCNYQAEVRWYTPVLTGLDSDLATTWSTEQSGNIVSRQCVTQNATTGLYDIDTTVTAAAAGFDLLDSTDASFADVEIAPPVLSGLSTMTVE